METKEFNILYKETKNLYIEYIVKIEAAILNADETTKDYIKILDLAIELYDSYKAYYLNKIDMILDRDQFRKFQQLYFEATTELDDKYWSTAIKVEHMLFEMARK